MRKTIPISILALVSVAAPAAAQTYSIGTNPQGSSAYSTGAAIARVAKDKLDMRARVVPQGGPVVTLPLVSKGQLDSSITVSIMAAFAYQGRGSFEGRAQKNVRVVAVVRRLRVGTFVRKDSKIQSIADLKGSRINSGFAKQKIMDVLWRATLAMPGYSYKDVRSVPAPNGLRGLDDFMEGSVDAAQFSLTSGKVRQMFASVDARYVSVPNDPKAIERMQQIAPGTVVETVEPSPALAGVSEPTRVIAAPFIVTAGTHVSEDTVYKLTKAIAENKELMVSVFKGISSFDPNKMHVDIGVPYHPGAMKYYRETGQVK